MIVTEKEAQGKLCSFANGFNASMTRMYKVDGKDATYSQPMCCGSECMSWEFVDDEHVSSHDYAFTLFGWTRPPNFNADEADNEKLMAMYDEWFADHGWTLVNKFEGLTTRSWSGRYRRLHPARKGQCTRSTLLRTD